ncbi:MAG TPA: DUF6597 domain-containing transcriptional factor, partial [Myxococcota bacterium]|nr:DUF6597 domain-containing transcriptional factor [Myxococcota bacterium]
MSYWEAAPDPRVAALVERVSFSRDEGAGPYPPVRVVPDGGVDLLFSVAVDGACAGQLFGLKTRPLWASAPGWRENVALRLRPGAAQRLFGVPAHALADAAPELRDLAGASAAELCARIGAAASLRGRQVEAERALARWAAPARAPDAGDALLHRMVTEIRRRRGALRVGPL